MAALAKPLSQVDEEIEQSLVALSVAMARQLVRRELKTSEGEIVNAVRESLGVLPVASRNVALFLHPEDVAIVSAALGVPGSESGWQIFDDPSMTRGGCREETETSRIDATVERRLANVVAQVLGGDRSEDRLA